MKVHNNKIREIILFVLPLSLASFELLLAGLWAKRDAWITAGLSVVGALIWAMVFCAVLGSFIIARKLDKHFDRLEQILKAKEKKKEKEEDKEQSNEKQNISEPKTHKPNDLL